jgi:cell division protein FtsN
MLVVLTLTFALGLLVGRQWARQAPSEASAEPGRKVTLSGRRSGLAEPAAETHRLQEKLTFYHALTAPLGPMAPAPAADLRPEAGAGPRSAPASPPAPPSDNRARAAERSSAAGADGGGHGSMPAAPPGQASPDSRGAGQRDVRPAPAKVTEVPAPSALTLQVGAFKSRGPAESLQRSLSAAGFDAYVAEIGGEGEGARYRVRVGSFRSREEAARMAERLRAERSLTAFVTAK